MGAYTGKKNGLHFINREKESKCSPGYFASYSTLNGEKCVFTCHVYDSDSRNDNAEDRSPFCTRYLLQLWKTLPDDRPQQSKIISNEKNLISLHGYWTLCGLVLEAFKK